MHTYKYKWFSHIYISVVDFAIKQNLGEVTNALFMTQCRNYWKFHGLIPMDRLRCCLVFLEFSNDAQHLWDLFKPVIFHGTFLVLLATSYLHLLSVGCKWLNMCTTKRTNGRLWRPSQLLLFLSKWLHYGTYSVSRYLLDSFN